MPEPAHDPGTEQARIMLGLLDSVERDGAQSQRRLASELGIALGLVNAYLRRGMRKGLVKVRQAPARRYIYYLTPMGFAEKSRLTVEYLSHSFEFFRRAKRDCTELFDNAIAHGINRVALAGKSDLAEIASICSLESSICIIGVVDPSANGERFMGVPLVRSFDELPEEPSAVVLTDLTHPTETCAAVLDRFGEDRVLIPQLLRLRLDRHNGNNT
jgi:DNA-binding MarR family transcriptional regulator